MSWQSCINKPVYLLRAGQQKASSADISLPDEDPLGEWVLHQKRLASLRHGVCLRRASVWVGELAAEWSVGETSICSATQQQWSATAALSSNFPHANTRQTHMHAQTNTTTHRCAPPQMFDRLLHHLWRNSWQARGWIWNQTFSSLSPGYRNLYLYLYLIQGSHPLTGRAGGCANTEKSNPRDGSGHNTECKMWTGSVSGCDRVEGHLCQAWIRSPPESQWDTPPKVVDNRVKLLCDSRFQPGEQQLTNQTPQDQPEQVWKAESSVDSRGSGSIIGCDLLYRQRRLSQQAGPSDSSRTRQMKTWPPSEGRHCVYIWL